LLGATIGVVGAESSRTADAGDLKKLLLLELILFMGLKTDEA